MKNIIRVLLAGAVVLAPSFLFSQDQKPAPSAVRPALPDRGFFTPEIPGKVMPAYPAVIPDDPQPAAPVQKRSPLQWLLFPRYLIPPDGPPRVAVVREALAERKGLFIFAEYFRTYPLIRVVYGGIINQ